MTFTLNKKNTAVQIKAKQKEITAQVKQQEEMLINPAFPAEAKDAVNRKINELRASYDSLSEELVDLEEREIKSARAELISMISANHLAYVASDAKYVYVKNLSSVDSSVNLVMWYLDWKKLLGMLTKYSSTPTKFRNLCEADVAQAFYEAKQYYLAKTFSFNEPKWNKDDVFNVLSVQRKYWAPINNGSEYSPFFDDLIYSLCGGKQENIEYLEKWVAFKYLYPEKHKIIPGINITGKPGGNGKGMFIAILKSIFNESGVAIMKSKSLTGGFNSQIEGKVLAIMDDEKKDGFAQTELKQAAGNASQVIEPKGVDAYTVDSTANLIILDNTGLVKLAGGGSAGEDRRWSIIDTEITLLEILSDKYGFNPDEAKQLAEEMGKMFEDRIEVGKWLSAMIQKHKVNQMAVIQPLHGADYKNRLEEQKDQFHSVFEQICPVLIDQRIFPARFLGEIIEAELGKKINPTTLDTRFKEYLSRKGIKNVEKIQDRVTKLYWKTELLTDNIRTSVYSLDGKQPTMEFEYSLISNTPFSKKAKITSETIELADLQDRNTEISDLETNCCTAALLLTRTQPIDFIDDFSSSSLSSSLRVKDTTAAEAPKMTFLTNKMKELSNAKR
jgi:hypothetical protein